MIRFTKILRPLFLIVSLLFFLKSGDAQNHLSSSKKAVKYFDKAKKECFDNPHKSLEYINKALSYDDDFVEAFLFKAELCVNLGKDSLAIDSYQRLFEIDSISYARCSMSLSRLYAKYFNFDKAIDLLQWYMTLENQKEAYIERAMSLLRTIEFQKNLVENPVAYNPVNVGTGINTNNDEYVNQYHVSENKIVFTRHQQLEQEASEYVCVSEMIDSAWTLPVLLFDGIDDYVGAANISSDGNEIYFSGCGWSDSYGSCDIYYVEFKDGHWSTPVNLQSVNTSDWESQPCISYDGRELYFVRGNKRTGSSDIYVSKRDVDGRWLKAERLSANINTDEDEMAPFVHHDGKTLYFSSSGHLGMGGLDLFVSRRDDNYEWGKPVNLGYPLNTSGDEINIVVSNNAKKAYVSALRSEGFGGFDIYEFDIDEKFRPQAVEIDMLSDEEEYAFAFEKKESVVLKHIYFAFDSAELTQDSEDGIDAVYDFLYKNLDVNIVLEGHTDDSGDADYNFVLSEKRAESVKNALVARGISADRIKTKGCGSTQPLFPNNFDDELKNLNRRVSMRF